MTISTMPIATIQTVTPELAEIWLARNTKNRRQRSPRIEMYARDMKNGHWRITGEAIKFNGNGTLLDGQHRLEACILAGVPFNTYVITGLPSDTQEVMDSGLGRRVSDQFALRGKPHSTHIASISRLVMRYDNNAIGGVDSKAGGKTRDFTNSEIISFAEADENRIVRAATFAPSIRKRMGAKVSFVGCAHYLSGNTHTAEFEGFMMRTAEGIGLGADTPELALRRWVERRTTEGRTRTTYGELAVIIKAFNAHISGRQTARLLWDPNSERFPRMIVGDRAHGGQAE